MSADNWRDCLRCHREAKESWQRAAAAARGAYGNVPMAEYESLKAAADSPPDVEAETLREDYETWIDDAGVFRVTYKASCDKCGFHFEFRTDAPTSEAAASPL